MAFQRVPEAGTKSLGAGSTSYHGCRFAASSMGCDVVEVYPQYDGLGQVTALLAANIGYEFLTLIADLRDARIKDKVIRR